MSNYKRPVICWGNDFTIKIELQQFLDGEFIDFNINDVKSLEVYLICSTHQQKIPLDWKIESGFDNVISCDVDYRLTHPNTSYGIGVEGIDKYDKHFRWYMTGKEGILIVPNTSGQNIPQDTEVVDLVGRVGWGISTEADLTNYYTKIEVNELLDQKVDKSELTDDYYDSETIDELLEAKADTSDLATVATTGDYNDLSNKPDLTQYATEQELNNYYDKGEVDGMLNNKVDTSTLNSDYYNKNTVNNLLDAKADTSDLAQVATSGSYNDLSNKPDLTQYATHQELADYVTQTDLDGELADYYDKGEVDGMLNNKVDTSTLNSDYYNKNSVNNLLDEKADTSDLAPVATSGSYNDLTNKPDLTQYATKSELNTKQDELVSGTNIKTINNQSLLGSGNIDIQGGGGGSYTAGKNIDITNNVISTTDDIDAGTITAEDIKIKETESGTVHYTRWADTANRYLAQYALEGTELRIGDQWYTYGNKGTLYVDTQNDGLITISYTEWTEDQNPPSWVPDWGGNPYKSTTTVNGYPVYGAYNPDSDSPDFYIYDADNYGINSMWVDYVNIPTEKPLTYWHIKGTGMYVDTNNTTNATFAGDRQISIGANNVFGSGGNVVMIGDELKGEYTGNQLIVGKYNKEKNALFTVSNGQSDVTFYAYSTSIDDDYTFTMWTTLPEEFFNESGNVSIRVITTTPEWTELFACGPYLSFWHLNYGNPYSENMELEYQGTTYYARITMQRDANNLGVTFELYTDDQHTVPYNIFASPAEVDISTVWFPIPWRRDAFLVTDSGDINIPYYQDKNNMFNLSEAIYNLEQRPQAVQSDWNESDSSSLSYIQNKPSITQPVQSDWNESDSSSLAYIQNKPTITQPVQSDWNETDTTSLAYIQNKPSISEPGFVKLVNGNNTGLVNSLATKYNINIGNCAIIEGDGWANGYRNSQASGNYSHSEGNGTSSSGESSHAEGIGTYANGRATHAEGEGTTAAAYNSHAEGNGTTTNGQYSHAEGYSSTTNTNATASHVEGMGNVTYNNSEHGQGWYGSSTNGMSSNFKGDGTTTLHYVGNGNGNQARHNAFEIKQNGDIYYSDTEKIDGSTVHYYDAPMRKLQDAMVTSTTNALKIEVVSVLPASPSNDTIYIIA